MNLAPIIVFSYNRSVHTRKVLEALKKNPLFDQSPLYLFCDGLKEGASEIDKIEHRKTVEIVTDEVYWTENTTVSISEENLGLAKSITQGVTKVIDKHGTAIILEDDIIVSTGFLKYMNDALLIYKDNSKVMHINGYLPKSPFQKNSFKNSTFFSSHMSCWGWATWKESWNKFSIGANLLYHKLEQLNLFQKMDLNGSFTGLDQLKSNIDGTISTWAIKWLSTILINDGICLNSSQSLVKNIGMDGSGVNSGLLFWNPYKTKRINSIENISKIPEKPNIGDCYFEEFYRYVNIKGYKRFFIKLYFYTLNRVFNIDTL
ncbi:hypothetical protein EI427_08300 [Flammeovirga pectinis]|uniref:Glycosyltransferase n=1 Tax=Flammeovirga pectinis TaxID=2494373 RepID=A0A3Q9FNF7_9BACT|nr:hypothetical protein [Flammeovirga pectinis]AZQ62237.1 hypothetical protein EI427_08300 [Flammeovirga pectinis]